MLVTDVDTADGPARLIVGVALDDVDASIAALIRSLLLTAPVALAALAAVVWWVVGRTLRPVEAANRRQQRFVADASHELRGPLARIRSELEVDLAHPDGSDPWRTHRSVLDEIERLQQLVDDLLQLARSDGIAPATPSVVDLDDVVLAEAERIRARGQLRVDLSQLSAAQLEGDRGRTDPGGAQPRRQRGPARPNHGRFRHRGIKRVRSAHGDRRRARHPAERGGARVRTLHPAGPCSY